MNPLPLAVSKRGISLITSAYLPCGSRYLFHGVLNVALCIFLSGCAASSVPSGSNGSVHTLYVLGGGPPFVISGLATNASGTSTPVSKLTLPSSFMAQAMTIDAVGQIYVAGIQGQSPSEILVYAAGSTGAAAPVRTILTGQPTADPVGAIAVDNSGDLYVADNLKGTVNIFAPSADGPSTPTRTIQLSASTFRGVNSLAVDGSGDLYLLGYVEGNVAGLDNPTEVFVYGPGASGSATPVRTIVGSNAEFGLNTENIAVDSAGDLYAIIFNPAHPFLNATEVAEFAPGATGNAAPVKTIIGNFGESGASPTHLQIDSSGNVCVVGQFVDFDLPQTPIPYPPFIAIFSPSATGTVSPTNQFTSAALDGGVYGFAAQ